MHLLWARLTNAAGRNAGLLCWGDSAKHAVELTGPQVFTQAWPGPGAVIQQPTSSHRANFMTRQNQSATMSPLQSITDHHSNAFHFAQDSGNQISTINAMTSTWTMQKQWSHSTGEPARHSVTSSTCQMMTTMITSNDEEALTCASTMVVTGSNDDAVTYHAQVPQSGLPKSGRDHSRQEGLSRPRQHGTGRWKWFDPPCAASACSRLPACCGPCPACSVMD